MDRNRTFAGPNRTGELELHFHEKVIRRDLRVARVEDLTERYRRITLTGDVLAEGFPFARFAPLDHVRAFFPNPDTGELVAYREVADAEWVLDGGSGDPIHRDYTVRAWDAARRELSLEFVLHEHGVAGRWARQAVPGDPLVVNGPSAHWFLPENYPHYLVAGDETALPMIARIIEEAPAGCRVTAVVEVTDARDELALSGAADLDLHWVHRATAPTGAGHLSPLETALRGHTLPADLGSLFVVIAGETNALRPIRRYFRHEVGLRGKQLVVDGYWKRGVPDFDHHDVDFDED
jgi:NADPH-dependent ferric siderophore reductase